LENFAVIDQGQPTNMFLEVSEAVAVAARQIDANGLLMRDAGARLRKLSPPFAATLARGSSDHAASFAKVLFELNCGMPTLSHSPSVGALFHATSRHFAGIPLFAISQSGRSPDLIAAASEVRDRGGFVVAMVNDTSSPLASLADITIPLHAGLEKSVAATKTFIAALVALVHLTAEWSGNATLLAALSNLNASLARAARHDWTSAIPALSKTHGLLVLGRGYTLPLAGEAALKLKETAGLHAEAFSLAEVAHGPMTLIGVGDPVLVFGPIDEARLGLKALIADFVARGAIVIGTGHPDDLRDVKAVLPSLKDVHPAVAAIGSVLAFYRLSEALARARGRDPDSPPFLSKVTSTL